MRQGEVMSLLPSIASEQRDPKEIKAHRIRMFVIILFLLGLPILFISLYYQQDASSLPFLVLGSYFFYAGYYISAHTPIANFMSYICFTLMICLFTVGAHLSAGAFSTVPVLYALLLVSTALIFDDIRALDITMLICAITYTCLVLFEIFVEEPHRAFFLNNLNAQNPNSIITIGIVFSFALTCIWYLLRLSLDNTRRSNEILMDATRATQARIWENEQLALEFQNINTSMFQVQHHMKVTVEALALPLIPLDNGVSLLPLVGNLDQERINSIQNILLVGIYEYKTQIVIVDLTGLSEIEDRALEGFLEAINGTQLLGARVILSGVNAQTATKLVEQKLSLQGVAIVSNLGQAFQYIHKHYPHISSRALGIAASLA
jgi:anti-anti-sigma regulatory factor